MEKKVPHLGRQMQDGVSTVDNPHPYVISKRDDEVFLKIMKNRLDFRLAEGVLDALVLSLIGFRG